MVERQPEDQPTWIVVVSAVIDGSSVTIVIDSNK